MDASTPDIDIDDSPFGARMRETHFLFTPGYRPLNHGSYGAFPRSVQEYRRSLQLECEARPDTFMRVTYPEILNKSRAAIAPLLGVDLAEVVFVPNATTGINTVLRNLSFLPGDVLVYFNIIYGACAKTIQSISETCPVATRRIDIAYPIEDDEIVDPFVGVVKSITFEGKRARIAMFDTVLTFPGVRFPWEALVAACKDLGIMSLVDGAHGVGHIDMAHVGSVSPDFMVSNCYKWLMVPRGRAVLYAPFRNQGLITTT